MYFNAQLWSGDLHLTILFRLCYCSSTWWWPKHVVEDRLTHVVASVVLALVIKKEICPWSLSKRGRTTGPTTTNDTATTTFQR